MQFEGLFDIIYWINLVYRKGKKMEQPILNGLMEYNTKGSYPWHMPGHKRQLQTIFPEIVDNPFSIDVTEVDGLDEFHCPTGIIKESLEQAGKIYGSDASYYLINGATVGILAAISSVCRRGDTIIVARNCHISVYHAIELLHLKPVYLVPEWDERLDIFTSMQVNTVRKAVKEHPEAKAVVLVSPTYEGVVSDIEKIAQVTHKKKIPVIVDEAHGAHFEYMANVNEAISTTNYKAMPTPAIRLGADIVIESLHKTLPAMTQCGILHRRGNLVDREKLEEFLSVYQSTSPSYVFMATIEACIAKMDHERDGLFIIYKELLNEYRKRFSQLQHIHLVDIGDFKKNSVYGYDIGKLIFSVKNCGIKRGETIEPFTGVMLGKMLNDEYGQMMEMCVTGYVIAMTSIADKKEAFEALLAALETIDRELIDLTEFVDMYSEEPINYNRIPDVKMEIGRALELRKHTVPLIDAVGKTSAAYIYAYPPGIPIVTPGEVISKEIMKELLWEAKRGCNLKGIVNPGDGPDSREDYHRLQIQVIQENKWKTKKSLFKRS